MSLYKHIEKASYLSWNNEPQQAQKDFQELSSYRANVEQCISLAMDCLTSGILPQKNETLNIIKQTQQRLESMTNLKVTQAMATLNHVLEYDEDNWKYNIKLDVKLGIAELQLVRGLILFSINSPLKAGWQLRKSWLGYSKLYAKLQKRRRRTEKFAQKKKLYKKRLQSVVESSILFGYGAFLYLLSILPPHVTQVLELIGFKSDQKLGVKLLREVADLETPYRSTAAIFILSLPYLISPPEFQDIALSLEKFHPYLQWVRSTFPNSPIFLYLDSLFHVRSGDHITGHELIDRGCRLSGKRLMRFNFEVGWMSAAKLDWLAGKEWFELIYKGEENNVRGISALLALGCYYHLKEYEKLDETLEKLPQYTSKSSRIDKFVIAKLELLNSIDNIEDKRKLCGFIIYEYLYFMRLYEFTSEDHSITLLKNIRAMYDEVKHMNFPELECSIAVMEFFLKKHDLDSRKECRKSLEKASQLDLQKEPYLIAFAFFGLAQLDYAEGNFHSCKENVLKMKSVNHELLKEFFASRINNCLRAINEKI